MRYAVLTVAGLVLAGGCETTLETGYTPRSLNASQADRRSYYAPAYTPEAKSDKDGVNVNLPAFGPS